MKSLPCFFSLLLICLAPAGVRAESDRPNIVFILADDLGYTDLGCHGSTYYETPNIDRLAREGLRFTEGYSCGPNCQPTRAALMSGQYGPRTGVYTVGAIDRFDWRSRPLRPVDNVTSLPADKTTLAQMLKSAGYATGMFGKWHLGNAGESHPSRRGFDEAMVSAGRHFNFVTSPPVSYPEGAYLADYLTDRSVDFIRRHRNQRFFLYLPHFAVHAPLEAKQSLIDKFKDKTAVGGHRDPTYAAMLASLDESVGRVLDTLDQLQLTTKTLVVFSSDNGGVGGYVREGIQANDITDNHPLRGGKGMLYEGGLRVPYIARWTGRIAPGGESALPINSVDLFPTLAEVAGAALPAGYPLDGQSYAAHLQQPQATAATEKTLYWHFPGYLGSGGNTWRTLPGGAVRAGDWKLIEFFEDGRLELYDLKNDVGERNNLAERLPEKTQELHALLTAWRKKIGAPMPTVNADIQSPMRARRASGDQKAANR